MIVAAIAGVLTALALPAISEVIRKERARGEVLAVADAVEEARNAARVEACTTLLTVNAAAATVTVGPDPADTDTHCVAMPSRVFAFNSTLITLAAFNVSNPLVFNASGGINAATHGLMTVTLAGGSTRTIEVWPATGAVRVK